MLAAFAGAIQFRVLRPGQPSEATAAVFQLRLDFRIYTLNMATFY